MNILLMALSTISGQGDNRNLRRFTYQFKDEPTFSGYYQLEPVTKYLNEKLIKEDQKLDYIITLNTDDVKDLLIKNVTYEGTDWNDSDISAEMMFKKSLTRGDKKFSELPHIISIPIDEDEIVPGIAKVVEKLREFKRKDHSLKLWIDIHGGIRNTQMSMQTILSLLKHESIFPSGIYDVKAPGDPCIIRDISDFFDYTDFVSGMNEFINFGKSISINNQIMKNDLHLKEFVEHANRISDALTLCNMQEFESQLISMSNWLKKNEIQEYSLVDLFTNNIREDYGILLERHNVLDEIEWCLKKGYLQQAMTLIESKMLVEIVKKDILTYDANATVSVIGRNANNESIRIEDAINRAKDSVNKAWEMSENFLIIRWIESLNMMDKIDNIAQPIALNKTREQYFTLTIPRTPNYNNRAYIGFEKGKGILVRLRIKNIIFRNNQLKDVLGHFLLLHYALKQERNSINHASMNIRYTTNNIRDAIGAYIDLAKKLYKV